MHILPGCSTRSNGDPEICVLGNCKSDPRRRRFRAGALLENFRRESPRSNRFFCVRTCKKRFLVHKAGKVRARLHDVRQPHPHDVPQWNLNGRRGCHLQALSLQPNGASSSKHHRSRRMDIWTGASLTRNMIRFHLMRIEKAWAAFATHKLRK